MPAALPNTKNAKLSTPTQAVEANKSIQNFLKGTTWPPVTNADREKMKDAILAFKEEIKKTRAQAAKKNKGNLVSNPIAQLASQTAKIGTELPGIAKFLPSGTDLNKVSFDQAVKSMENTITQLETFIKPTACPSPAPDADRAASGTGFIATDQG